MIKQWHELHYNGLPYTNGRAGIYGVATLMRNRENKELVAMKYIERGHRWVGVCVCVCFGLDLYHKL